MFMYHEDVDFKISGEFLDSKALKSVLNVPTLKVPTLTRRSFLRFTTLRLATDSEEAMVCQDRYLRLLSSASSFGPPCIYMYI